MDVVMCRCKEEGGNAELKGADIGMGRSRALYCACACIDKCFIEFRKEEEDGTGIVGEQAEDCVGL